MNISDYRPVSLLTTFWKVFEKVICSRLMEQFLKKILGEEQFGFRKNLATE
jgi:hypothetical protein